MAIFDWISRRVFNAVHGNNLVYNTCWEDPRLDREALRIGPGDEILTCSLWLEPQDTPYDRAHELMAHPSCCL
jgi:hypothetical protein